MCLRRNFFAKKKPIMQLHEKLLWVGGGLGGVWSLLAFQGYLINRLAAKEGIDIHDEEAMNQWANRRVKNSKGGAQFYRDILLQRPKKAEQ